MKALQGTWNVVSLEVEGGVMSDDMIAGSQIILKKNTFTTMSMGGSYARNLHARHRVVNARDHRHYVHRGARTPENNRSVSSRSMATPGPYVLAWPVRAGRRRVCDDARQRSCARDADAIHVEDVTGQAGIASCGTCPPAPRGSGRTTSGMTGSAVVNAGVAAHQGEWVMVSIDPERDTDGADGNTCPMAGASSVATK